MTDNNSKKCMRSILVGIEMGPADQTLYSYISCMVNRTKPDFISFLHVMPKPWNIKHGWDISHPDEINMLREIEKSIFNEIKSNIEASNLDIPKDSISIQIKMGDPLTQLLKYAKAINPQLVVIGQKKSSGDHGILSKNILQKVIQNAVVIPEGHDTLVKKILVPMDFSENAKSAFNRAIIMRNSLDQDIEITVLNIFEMVNLHKGMYNIMDEYLHQQEKQVNKEFDNVFKEYDKSELKNVHTRFLITKHNSIGYNISQFAKQNNMDFIIMGAKGHSTFEHILMGSVTERVLTNELFCPVMIIKN